MGKETLWTILRLMILAVAMRNLEASVRSRDSGDTKRWDRDLIEAGLN
jgi:hypothetical protein